MIFIIPLFNICYLNRVKETANNKLHLFSRRVLCLWVKPGSDLAVQSITPLKINQESVLYSAESTGQELEFLFNIYIKNNERFTGLSLVRTSEVCIKVLYNI